MDELKRNGSGCVDPTAYEAIKNIDREDDVRFSKLLSTLFAICELSGFHIEERVVIKDLKTGKIYR